MVSRTYLRAPFKGQGFVSRRLSAARGIEETTNGVRAAPEYFYNAVAALAGDDGGAGVLGATREGASGFDTKAPRTSAFAGLIAAQAGPGVRLNPSREKI